MLDIHVMHHRIVMYPQHDRRLELLTVGIEWLHKDCLVSSLLGPTVFHASWNFEPSCKICPLSQNFMQFYKNWVMTD